MTFDASIPLSADSPATFPAQNQTNMGRLQTIVGADHQFNLSAAADDGYHNIVHLTQQAPSGVLAATGRLYAKSSASRIHAFYMDDQASDYQITPTMPIRASVNFNAAGTIRSSFNVSSVSHPSTGNYTINFTTNMPNTNYIVQVTGMRDTASRICICGVKSDSTYSNSVAVGSVKVEFWGNNEAPRDVLMGNVTIFSVT